MFIKRDQFTLDGQVVLGRVVFHPPFKASSPLKDEARFVHVIRGRSKLYSPNKTFDLCCGDSVIMRCENFLNHWLEREGDEPNEVIILQLFRSVLDNIYEGQPPKFTTDNNIEINPVEKIQPNQIVDNYIQGLRFYIDNPNLMSDQLLKIKIQELIHVMASTDETGHVKSILSDLFNRKEYEFKEIIHSHLYEDLKLDDLAYFTGLSLSSFKRKFKSTFGTSPTQYIKSKRLDKAQRLIKQSEQRISEIAFECGFNDLSYFSKSFTATYNLSPSEYRKFHLNGSSK